MPRKRTVMLKKKEAVSLESMTLSNHDNQQQLSRVQFDITGLIEESCDNTRMNEKSLEPDSKLELPKDVSFPTIESADLNRTKVFKANISTFKPSSFRQRDMAANVLQLKKLRRLKKGEQFMDKPFNT